MINLHIKNKDDRLTHAIKKHNKLTPKIKDNSVTHATKNNKLTGKNEKNSFTHKIEVESGIRTTLLKS